MSEPCPFCVLDESRVAFRDGLVFAIWDRYPVSKGHLLVVTKRHVADWFEASEVEQHAVLHALERGRKIILDQHAADGFNVGVNIGTAAGQTVPHLHVHLIPRFVGDVPDPTGGVRYVIPSRANYLKSQRSGIDLLQGPSVQSLLVRGADDPLLPHVRACLDQAASADFAVAFILKSGIALVREHLRDLLDKGGRVRIVTGDYLNATDPDALVDLMDLGDNLQLRVFEAGRGSSRGSEVEGPWHPFSKVQRAISALPILPSGDSVQVISRGHGAREQHGECAWIATRDYQRRISDVSLRMSESRLS